MSATYPLEPRPGTRAARPPAKGATASAAKASGKAPQRTTSLGQAAPANPVLAQLAALKSMPMPALKQRWRDLCDTEPPPYNRRFLESRLAYRIQELAYGGLKPETIERLVALGKQLDGGNAAVRKRHADSRPIAGTQLIREWKGVEHRVTVRADDFEHQGRPYQSLSAVARAITGTRWNGLMFFGLKNQRGRT